MHRSLLLLALVTPVTAAPLLCMWDYDTLLQEEARFPNTIELMTGRFPRHSDAYYRWRIQDREARLEASPQDVRLLDDLAVAFSKLHKRDKAIALMEQKERHSPGLYETAANLGTFYIHAGEFEEGAKHIARAIEINPDAHFGREVYQLLLVRYVLSKREESGSLSLPMQTEFVGGIRSNGPRGFWDFVRSERDITDDREVVEIELAVKGVLGMLRFGNHDSPVLCEALSDLLLANTETDAKLLAARALLQASYMVEDPAGREQYRGKASAALNMQTPDGRQSRSVTLEEVAALFDEERAEARAWWKKLEKAELQWIEAEQDVDARFAEEYYGVVKRAGAGSWLSSQRGNEVCLALGATLLALLLVRRRYRLAAMKEACPA